MQVVEKVRSKSASPIRVAAKKLVIPLDEMVKKFGAFQSEEPVSKGEFLALNEMYPDLRMEREKNGKVTVMSPVKKGSGDRESLIHGLVFMWNYNEKKGSVYGSSAGFDLPDGATKSPDVAWISNERLQQVKQDPEADFILAVPDFVCEIRSWSDRLGKLQRKMKTTWMANGVRLGWLIDPYQEQVFIYRQDQEMETITGFDGKTLSGEDVLEGFSIELENFKRKLTMG